MKNINDIIEAYNSSYQTDRAKDNHLKKVNYDKKQAIKKLVELINEDPDSVELFINDILNNISNNKANNEIVKFIKNWVNTEK